MGIVKRGRCRRRGRGIVIVASSSNIGSESIAIGAVFVIIVIHDANGYCLYVSNILDFMCSTYDADTL